MLIQFVLALGILAYPLNAKLAQQATPPMGWNSYNAYTCTINERDVMENAKALVDKGFLALGYNMVTTDCAWNADSRDYLGRLQWNSTTFPSGGKALGDYLHNLGLKFGMYSGAGYKMCLPSDFKSLPASLDYEGFDANSFAYWGADSLKYDNCYATSPDIMGDSSSEEAKSSRRFRNMAIYLDRVERNISYYVCQWGIGENVGEWSNEIRANSWRVSGDIAKGWGSIWRIVNQRMGYNRGSGVGNYPDMDMLEVGNGGMTDEEDRFHFKMWAIMKSPLILGNKLNQRIPIEAENTLKNKEVIAINQDPLGKGADLIIRNTEEEYDVFLGPLSGNRLVLGIANWRNVNREIAFNLNLLDISAAYARDVWVGKDLGRVSGTQHFQMNAHELKLWVLSNVNPFERGLKGTGYKSARDATLTGDAKNNSCPTYCHPSKSRIQWLRGHSRATFNHIKSSTAGKKLLRFHYINYQYGENENIRNLTIVVNSGKWSRVAVPLSGQNWFESKQLSVELDDFKEGDNNSVEFGGWEDGWAPDIVGMEVFE